MTFKDDAISVIRYTLMVILVLKTPGWIFLEKERISEPVHRSTNLLSVINGR